MKIVLFIFALLSMVFLIKCSNDNNGTGPWVGPNYDRKDVYINVSVKDPDGEGIDGASVRCYCYYSNEDIKTIIEFFMNQGGYGSHRLKIIAKKDGNDTVLVVARKRGYEDSDTITVLPLQDGHTENLDFVLNPLE